MSPGFAGSSMGSCTTISSWALFMTSILGVWGCSGSVVLWRYGSYGYFMPLGSRCYTLGSYRSATLDSLLDPIVLKMGFLEFFLWIGESSSSSGLCINVLPGLLLSATNCTFGRLLCYIAFDVSYRVSCGLLNWVGRVSYFTFLKTSVDAFGFVLIFCLSL